MLPQLRRLAAPWLLWTLVGAGGWLIAALYLDRASVLDWVGRAADRMSPPASSRRTPPPGSGAERLDSRWMKAKIEDDPDFLRHREERRLARRAAAPP